MELTSLKATAFGAVAATGLLLGGVFIGSSLGVTGGASADPMVTPIAVAGINEDEAANIVELVGDTSPAGAGAEAGSAGDQASPPIKAPVVQAPETQVQSPVEPLQATQPPDQSAPVVSQPEYELPAVVSITPTRKHRGCS